MSAALFDLTGRTALVTGSSRGLGFALARGLGRAGAEIVLHGSRTEGAEAAAEALRAEGVSVRAVAFDVADPDAVAAGFEALRQVEALPDILVNNAGVNLRHPLAEFPLEDWRRVMAVHLDGAFLVARAAAGAMRERGGGKIVNLCSLTSEVARPGIAAYATAKGGMRMLTRAMAVEWASDNIQCNGIAPGYFATDMNRALVEDEAFDAWVRGRTPAGRWGEPDDLVGAAVFLASRASDFVTGQMLAVDGGFLASM